MELMTEQTPLEDLLLFERKPVSESSHEVHIWFLIKRKTWYLKQQRLWILTDMHFRLEAWWHNPDIRKIILKTDRRLTFNLDVTSVYRIIESAERVVCEVNEHPEIPSQMRDGNHITLVPIISASGDLVKPYVILHCERADYVNESVYPVKTYRTANGYMDQKTFVDILRDVFIPYVNDVRRQVRGNKHAVLIVDGHISRYSLEGIALLRDPVNDIDLIVLPAHSSHVSQPLDLGLNHFIKLYFRQEWPNAKPEILIVCHRPGRPQRRSEVNSGSCYVSQFSNEPVEETEARVARTVSRRAKIVHALVSALEKACTRQKIKSAFKQAGLVPLAEDPPYTKEKEEQLVKQVLKMGIELPKETARKKEHITGILTCDAAVEKIKARPDLAQSGSGGHKRGRRPSIRTSSPEDSVQPAAVQGCKRGRKPNSSVTVDESEDTTQPPAQRRKRDKTPRVVTPASSVTADDSEGTVQPPPQRRKHRSKPIK